MGENQRPVDFLYAIHNHQPVGNFGHVFEESFDKCYGPQIEVLQEHPGVKLALHQSGPLLEWIEQNRPKFIDTIAALAEKGQIELLSGGFYEPILSVIPEEDAIGQIVMMNDYIEKRFGQKPRGMWLAERIWESDLPKILSAAGIEFTLLDDTHFTYAGLEPEDMRGYYVTEKHGATLAIFPIDKNLRYSIPFKMPHENIDYFQRLQERGGRSCVTYGDDGEKYGVWPDTYDWVFGQKWLHNFYSALEENSAVVRTLHFSDYRATHRAEGRVYLPIASYEEMMEWTLPAKMGERFHHTLEELEQAGKRDDYRPFIRGGIWSNFQTKYDESNRLHKKMLAASELVAASPDDAARRALYAGQCNCPYWHGLFGGLYLNYLRHAVYAKMIEAETLADKQKQGAGEWITACLSDYDKDGDEELVVKTDKISLVIDPSYGGTLLDFAWKPACFMITNTLTRQREAYHTKVTGHDNQADTGEEPASIHDIVHLKEEGLAERIVYDKAFRRNFQDSFFDRSVTLEQFARSNYDERGDFIKQPFTITTFEPTEQRASLTLQRNGFVGSQQVTVIKEMTVARGGSALQCRYRVRNQSDGPLETTMAVSFNLTLLAADADDRYWVGDSIIGKPHLRESGVEKGITRIGMRDDWAHFEITLTSSEPMNLWRFPVETVSQSEGGFERTWQGAALTFTLPLSLAPDADQTFTLTLDVEAMA